MDTPILERQFSISYPPNCTVDPCDQDGVLLRADQQVHYEQGVTVTRKYEEAVALIESELGMQKDLVKSALILGDSTIGHLTVSRNTHAEIDHLYDELITNPDSPVSNCTRAA